MYGFVFWGHRTNRATDLIWLILGLCNYSELEYKAKSWELKDITLHWRNGFSSFNCQHVEKWWKRQSRGSNTSYECWRREKWESHVSYVPRVRHDESSPLTPLYSGAKFYPSWRLGWNCLIQLWGFLDIYFHSSSPFITNDSSDDY